jgi:hypothetical protein
MRLAVRGSAACIFMSMYVSKKESEEETKII